MGYSKHSRPFSQNIGKITLHITAMYPRYFKLITKRLLAETPPHGLLLSHGSVTLYSVGAKYLWYSPPQSVIHRLK